MYDISQVHVVEQIKASDGSKHTVYVVNINLCRNAAETYSWEYSTIVVLYFLI